MKYAAERIIFLVREFLLSLRNESVKSLLKLYSENNQLTEHNTKPLHPTTMENNRRERERDHREQNLLYSTNQWYRLILKNRYCFLVYVCGLLWWKFCCATDKLLSNLYTTAIHLKCQCSVKYKHNNNIQSKLFHESSLTKRVKWLITQNNVREDTKIPEAAALRILGSAAGNT